MKEVSEGGWPDEREALGLGRKAQDMRRWPWMGPRVGWPAVRREKRAYVAVVIMLFFIQRTRNGAGEIKVKRRLKIIIAQISNK